MDTPTELPTATTKQRIARGPDQKGWFWGTGRRKTAVARVRVKGGSGKFEVNDKDIAEFFVEERDRQNILSVLEKTGLKGKVDVKVNTCGGGTTGQCGATLLGLGRAVLDFDATLEPILREHGFLTRDARKVERKKYGQAG
ncbi:MAG: 30S ribosomal protein S9, partial [Planctomycetota bacterium]